MRFQHNRPHFLDRLEREFGIKGHARRWLESYFRDRMQAVYVNSTSSVMVPQDIGFPKGSLISPFGFKDLHQTPISHSKETWHQHSYMYADDTQIYVSCDLGNVDMALACIEDIRD